MLPLAPPNPRPADGPNPKVARVEGENGPPELEESSWGYRDDRGSGDVGEAMNGCVDDEREGGREPVDEAPSDGGVGRLLFVLVVFVVEGG